MTIIDKRTKKIASPDIDWIPSGVSNLCVDIKDRDSNIIGNIEIGSDGFIQAMWDDKGVHYRLEKHPSIRYATLRGWALR